MCARITCTKCGKPTFTGCGAHIEQVLGNVPPLDRCQGHNKTATPPPRGGTPGAH